MLSKLGMTPLHVAIAAGSGHAAAVLRAAMTEDALGITDMFGRTAAQLEVELGVMLRGAGISRSAGDTLRYGAGLPASPYGPTAPPAGATTLPNPNAGPGAGAPGWTSDNPARHVQGTGLDRPPNTGCDFDVLDASEITQDIFLERHVEHARGLCGVGVLVAAQ